MPRTSSSISPTDWDFKCYEKTIQKNGLPCGGTARKDRAVLLDGGDIYQGNTMSNLLEGDSLSAAYMIMGYDAVTIGNHELLSLTETGRTFLSDMTGAYCYYTDETVNVLMQEAEENSGHLTVDKTSYYINGEYDEEEVKCLFLQDLWYRIRRLLFPQWEKAVKTR